MPALTDWFDACMTVTSTQQQGYHPCRRKHGRAFGGFAANARDAVFSEYEPGRRKRVAFIGTWPSGRMRVGFRASDRADEVFAMKVLKIAGIVLGTIVVVIGIVGFALFGGLQGAAAGPSLGAGIDRVQAGYSTAYVLDAGNGQFVLIDAGADGKGAALIQDLQARHAAPENVAAVLLTHAHPDHIGALALFPKATIYALKREVPIAAGQEPFNGPVFKLFGGKNTSPFNVTHPLDDGESFMVGNLQVTAYAVPGHTEGSAAYLIEGVLFAGDSMQIKTNEQITGPSVVFSTDRAEGEASLKHLGQELQPRAAQVNFIATGHTGTVAGLSPLLSFGGS